MRLELAADPDLWSIHVRFRVDLASIPAAPSATFFEAVHRYEPRRKNRRILR
jgi:hypothetical protein